MLPPQKVAVVIPCLNEEKTVGHLVGEIRQTFPHVIVIDDGSNDRTGELARDAGADVISHDKPKGKGFALTAGWTHALQQGFEWAVCMDGDGQHLPSDIPALVSQCPAPLVVGNRMHSAKHMPPLRRWVNRWMSNRLSRLVQQSLSDTQCGFRVMSLKCWAGLTIDTTHFEIESDVLLAFALAGHEIRFAPIQVVYKNEQSKIHPVRDTIRWFRWYSRAKRRVRETAAAGTTLQKQENEFSTVK